MTPCFRRAGTVEDSQERLTFRRIGAKMEVFVETVETQAEGKKQYKNIMAVRYRH